jgi:hypothetical protein
MPKVRLTVERDGWFIQIEVIEVVKRPDWEIRCGITRSREGGEDADYRGHRFCVPPELAQKARLDRLSEAKRGELLAAAAKKVILRELQEIFSEPGGGLDAVRPLSETDLKV